MNKRALLSSAAISVFSTLLAYFMLGDPAVQAQAQSAGGIVKKTASVTESSDSRSRFSKAALENAKLRISLQWVFGGKTQTGWNIYAPLISHTIGSESGPDSTEFALALSKWQEKSGLVGTGALDSETLESFTKYWQSRRLGRAGLSAADS